MSPDDIRSLRKELGLTQRQLAEALKLDPATVRAWESEALFPTKAHCDAMAALRAQPPPKLSRKPATPFQVLADPDFFALLRKLVAHAKLRAEIERLAAAYPDPIDE
jgi:transcriptional regulator with XRE-family HTH domain